VTGRAARIHLRTAALLAFVLGALTPTTAAAATGSGDLTADLDGRPIKLELVGNWYCDDFSYPAIHCFSSPQNETMRTASVLAVTAVDFVTVYEYTSWAGSYMHMSQDYTVLATIGWNDRISSLKGRNSETSHFYVDWFNGGASYALCCNSQISSLGSFDNTFSSVRRG
jgi:hypothetical protein